LLPARLVRKSDRIALVSAGDGRYPTSMPINSPTEKNVMRLKWLALAGAAALLAGTASAQQATPPAPPARDFSKVEVKTTDLGNKTYMLEGDGGNITVAVGTDGIIMVDGEFAPLHDKIKAAIEAVSKE